MLDGEMTHRKSFLLPPETGEVMAMDLQKVKRHPFSIHSFIINHLQKTYLRFPRMTMMTKHCEGKRALRASSNNAQGKQAQRSYQCPFETNGMFWAIDRKKNTET